MKRLITLLVAVAIGITIFAAPMVADPGATTDTSSTTGSTDSTWIIRRHRTDMSAPGPRQIAP